MDEATKEWMRARRAELDEKVRRRVEDKEINGPGRKRAALEKRIDRYGITTDDYDKILRSQGFVCGICRREMENPQVDHDHNTGYVRGILCIKCNTAIGQLGDDSDSVLRAVAYLQRAEAADPGRRDRGYRVY